MEGDWPGCHVAHGRADWILGVEAFRREVLLGFAAGFESFGFGLQYFVLGRDESCLDCLSNCLL